MKPIEPIVFACVPVVLSLYLLFHKKPWRWTDKLDFWLTIIAGLSISAILTAGMAAAGSGIARLIGSHSDQIWHQCWHGSLISMRSADGVQGKLSGGMFLMIGYMNSQQVYYYYTRNADGSFQPGRWTPDSDMSVFEEDRADGEVFQYDSKFQHPWIEWIGITNDRLRMDFHVPKGSIERRFDLK